MKRLVYCIVVAVLSFGIGLRIHDWLRPPAPKAALSAAKTAGRAVPPSLLALRGLRRSLQPSGPPRVQVQDLRTPEQLTQAACMGSTGWVCKTPRPTTFGATAPNNAVTTPVSWSVSSWFVDDANVTTCASDTNNGTVATCGATGIGPLQHKREIVRRWGTHEPILTIPVSIKYLSADTDGTDPGIFRPIFVSEGSLTHKADLPAATFTGTLNVVTPKAFSPLPGNALETTFTTSSGAVTARMLLVNSTHSSHAIAQRILSGSTWQISQPFVPYITGAYAAPTNVDTWTSGDSIHGYVPLSVNISVVGGTEADLNQSTFGPGHIVQQVTILNPGTFNPMVVDAESNPAFIDTVFQRAVAIRGNSPPSLFQWFDGCVFTQQTVTQSNYVDVAGGVVEVGGSYTNIALSNDVIMQGSSGILGGGNDLDDAEVFLDTGAVLDMRGFTFIAGGSILGKIYGPGTFEVRQGLIGYHETAADHFYSQLQINGSTTACAYDATGDPALIHCGRSLTAALIDTSVASGGFGGNAFIPGIGSIAFTN